MTIGEQIKKIRQNRKISQEKLAKELGFSSKGSVYDIESGRVKPSWKTLSKLCEVFDCTFEINLKEK